MSINISTSMGFENSEIIKNNAKNILQQNGVETVKANNASQEIISFNNGLGFPAQNYVLMASTQITVNNTLRETLQYLKNHRNNTKKEPVLGELWAIMNTENNSSEENPYHGDLLDFEIDSNTKNIFAA